MNAYVVKLKHDKGIMRIYVEALSEDSAKHMIMECERCPERAIVSIKKVKDYKAK